MDVVRQKRISHKWLRWALLLFVIGGGIAATTAGLSSLEKALPEFERSSVILDEVKKGTMVREVRGPGTLVPEDVTSVTTEVGGTVHEVLVEAGVTVTPDTVLFRLRNPQIERDFREAERALETANDDVERYERQQKSERLDIKVATATARANYEDALAQAEINETLARRGLISKKQYEQSRDRAERNKMLLDVQVERAENSLGTQSLQMDARKRAVDQAKDRLAQQADRKKALSVLAGVSGVLQQLGSTGDGLNVGQRIAEGSAVAKISDPRRLMAELQISQTQTRDVVEGQPVRIDTRNGIVEGRVTRIDPEVRNDRVTVDVKLTGELPPGARPELSIEGLIEVARLEDVFHVRKPVYSEEFGRREIFRLEPDGETLVRTTVEYGAGSVHTIEVVAGLNEGDQIVVSDTTRWKSFDRVKLK